MNKMKFYLRTKGDMNMQANVYAEVFNGRVLKRSLMNQGDIKGNIGDDPKGELINFAYIELLNNINIILAFHKDGMPDRGYNGDIILTIDNREKYMEVYNNLKNSVVFGIDYDIENYEWGTSICKFYDKWGYGWVLEIKTSLLKGDKNE